MVECNSKLPSIWGDECMRVWRKQQEAIGFSEEV